MRVYKKHTQKTACNYLINSSVTDCFIVCCFEARYYKPPTFTSRDPLMEQKPWLNPYHYCSNNPVGRIDPTGMDAKITGKDGTKTKYTQDLFTNSANNLLNNTTFSSKDFNAVVNLFKSESVINSSEIYNNYPIRRNNQKSNFLTRFYPLW